MAMLPSFSAQRARFLTAARAAGAQLTHYPHPLRGPQGEELATDVAVIGDPQAKKRQVILSGTHGVEGYYGSDNQIRWLESEAVQALPADTAVVLLHLINPWGTAHLRRVNEDNLDLNRNFIDFSQPLPAKPAYQALHDAYACADWQQAQARFQHYCQQQGWPAVKSVVEAGQYQHADGIFYGGVEPCWSQRTLKTLIDSHLTGAEQVHAFDLHTGAGAYGHPMLMAIAERSYPALAQAHALFDPWLIEIITGATSQSDSGVTATATGYVSQFMLDNLPDTALQQYVIECGTLPGEEMHRRVRQDHWLHLYGDVNSAEGQAIKQALFDGFYPSDPDWRALTMLRTQQIFARSLAALIASA